MIPAIISNNISWQIHLRAEKGGIPGYRGSHPQRNIFKVSGIGAKSKIPAGTVVGFSVCSGADFRNSAQIVICIIDCLTIRIDNRGHCSFVRVSHCIDGLTSCIRLCGDIITVGGIACIGLDKGCRCSIRVLDLSLSRIPVAVIGIGCDCAQRRNGFQQQMLFLFCIGR